MNNIKGAIVAIILMLAGNVFAEPPQWKPDLSISEGKVLLMKFETTLMDHFRLTNWHPYTVCVEFTIREGYNYQSSVPRHSTVLGNQTIFLGTIFWYNPGYRAEWKYDISATIGECPGHT